MGILVVKGQVLIWILIKEGNVEKSDLNTNKILLDIRNLNIVKKSDTLSNQFSIKCLLLERKMKKSDNAKRGLSKIDNK